VATLGAFVLLFGGLLGTLAAWNAARPPRSPTRRYSARWLPAMVVSELSVLCLVVTVAVTVVGLGLGGASNIGGFAGALLLGLTILLLGYLIIRGRVAARWLWPLITGPVHPARGVARLTGIPIGTPSGVVEEHGIEYRSGCTLDLVAPAPRPAEAPVFVYVHGGGWTNGDPQRQARDLYHALALAGWVVLAIRYPFTPSVIVEEQVDAVRSAIRWARRGLPEAGTTATAVAVGGGSAGGHLATLAALTPVDGHATAWKPPSTCTIDPVVMGNQSDSRATHALATRWSRSRPSRAGPRSSHTSSKREKPGIDFAAIVLMGPAATRLHRMPCGPSSLAR
jgi:acetyl esterase/lipase